MPIQCCICLDKSVRIHYEGFFSKKYKNIKYGMLQIIDELDRIFEDVIIWGSTSIHVLNLVSKKDYSDRYTCVSIAPQILPSWRLKPFLRYRYEFIITCRDKDGIQVRSISYSIKDAVIQATAAINSCCCFRQLE